MPLGATRNTFVVGAGLIGCETALYLAKKGRNVTIAGGRRLAHDMVWGNALDLLKQLDDHEVKILTNHRILRITEMGAESAAHRFETESIVLAVGMNSIQKITVEELEKEIPEVYAIGDCVSPRHVMSAIWEGYRKARLI